MLNNVEVIDISTISSHYPAVSVFFALIKILPGVTLTR